MITSSIIKQHYVDATKPFVLLHIDEATPVEWPRYIEVENVFDNGETIMRNGMSVKSVKVDYLKYIRADLVPKEVLDYIEESYQIQMSTVKG